MKKLLLLSILFSLVFISCNDEPDPVPADIRAYCYLYHFIPELGSVIWEVAESEVPQEQLFGVQFAGAILLETIGEEVTFTAKHGGTRAVLISQSFQLEQNKFYNVIVHGSIEDPVMLIREIETGNPETGKVKFQTLHSLPGQSPIDVYMGGSTQNNRFVSELAYLSLTIPYEVNDFDARAAITVSAHSEEYNQDSVLLTSVYNDEILTNAYYLTVLALSGHQVDSDTTLWVYELPLDQ